MLDNPPLLMVLILAVAVMGSYYCLKRAQTGSSSDGAGG